MDAGVNRATSRIELHSVVLNPATDAYAVGQYQQGRPWLRMKEVVKPEGVQCCCVLPPSLRKIATDQQGHDFCIRGIQMHANFSPEGVPLWKECFECRPGYTWASKRWASATVMRLDLVLAAASNAAWMGCLIQAASTLSQLEGLYMDSADFLRYRPGATDQDVLNAILANAHKLQVKRNIILASS